MGSPDQADPGDACSRGRQAVGSWHGLLTPLRDNLLAAQPNGNDFPMKVLQRQVLDWQVNEHLLATLSSPGNLTIPMSTGQDPRTFVLIGQLSYSGKRHGGKNLEFRIRPGFQNWLSSN